MRRFFHLLALMALLFAPLAAPAAAMTAKPTAAECTDMAMEMGKAGKMAGHEMPAADHGQGEACCIAIPPAIDPPLSAMIAIPAIVHLAFVADSAPFRLGAGPKAEDPPPRTA